MLMCSVLPVRRSSLSAVAAHTKDTGTTGLRLLNTLKTSSSGGFTGTSSASHLARSLSLHALLWTCALTMCCHINKPLTRLLQQAQMPLHAQALGPPPALVAWPWTAPPARHTTLQPWSGSSPPATCCFQDHRWQLPTCCVLEEAVIPLGSSLAGLCDHDAIAVLQPPFYVFCDQLLPQFCLWGARHNPCHNPISVRSEDLEVLSHGQPTWMDCNHVLFAGGQRLYRSRDMSLPSPLHLCSETGSPAQSVKL